jgi:putative tricarboxylic transport membrane protein
MFDKALSCFFLLFSLVYLFSAKTMTFGTFSSPKSGFMPVIAGTLGVILAVINLIGVFRKAPSEASEPDLNLKRLFLFGGGLVVYLAVLKFLGYALATFLVMFYLLKILGTKGWKVPLAVSLGVAGGFYLIFVSLLGITLP